MSLRVSFSYEYCCWPWLLSLPSNYLAGYLQEQPPALSVYTTEQWPRLKQGVCLTGIPHIIQPAVICRCLLLLPCLRTHSPSCQPLCQTSSHPDCPVSALPSTPVSDIGLTVSSQSKDPLNSWILFHTTLLKGKWDWSHILCTRLEADTNLTNQMHWHVTTRLFSIFGVIQGLTQSWHGEQPWPRNAARVVNAWSSFLHALTMAASHSILYRARLQGSSILVPCNM